MVLLLNRSNGLSETEIQIETVRPLSPLEAEVLRICLERWESEAKDSDDFVWVCLDSLLADPQIPTEGTASDWREKVRSAMTSLMLTGLVPTGLPVLDVTGMVRRGGAQIDVTGWRLRPGREIRRRAWP